MEWEHKRYYKMWMKFLSTRSIHCCSMLFMRTKSIPNSLTKNENLSKICESISINTIKTFHVWFNSQWAFFVLLRKKFLFVKIKEFRCYTQQKQTKRKKEKRNGYSVWFGSCDQTKNHTLFRVAHLNLILFVTNILLLWYVSSNSNSKSCGVFE